MNTDPLDDLPGGLVASWEGGEFCHVLPRVLEFIKAGTPSL